MGEQDQPMAEQPTSPGQGEGGVGLMTTLGERLAALKDTIDRNVLVVFILGVGLTWFGWREYRRWEITTADPEDVTLTEVLARGREGNPHVRVKRFDLYTTDPDRYSYELNKNKELRVVFVPMVPEERYSWLQEQLRQTKHELILVRHNLEAETRNLLELDRSLRNHLLAAGPGSASPGKAPTATALAGPEKGVRVAWGKPAVRSPSAFRARGQTERPGRARGPWSLEEEPFTPEALKKQKLPADPTFLGMDGPGPGFVILVDRSSRTPQDVAKRNRPLEQVSGYLSPCPRVLTGEALRELRNLYQHADFANALALEVDRQPPFPWPLVVTWGLGLPLLGYCLWWAWRKQREAPEEEEDEEEDEEEEAADEAAPAAAAPPTAPTGEGITSAPGGPGR
jgi:hypothetical protein